MENEVINGEQLSQNEGSPFGKFNSAHDLKNAYDNLEKEFTRKSQLLSEFQKEAAQTDGNNFKQSVNEDIKSQEEVMDEFKTPYWEKEDFSSEVEQFLLENPLAKEHAKEISEMVLKDKAIMQSKRPLYMAWAKWLQQNYKTPEQLLEDQTFLDKVGSNEKVRRAVIKNYLAEINNKEKTPPLFAVSDGSGSFAPKQKPLKSLDDVRELAKKIFS